MPPHVGPHFVLPLLNVNPPLPHWSPCPINHSHLSVSIQLQLNKHETSSSFPSKMLSYIIPFPSIYLFNILRNPFWFFPINFCGPGGFLWFQYAAGSDAARPFQSNVNCASLLCWIFTFTFCFCFSLSYYYTHLGILRLLYKQIKLHCLNLLF